MATAHLFQPRGDRPAVIARLLAAPPRRRHAPPGRDRRQCERRDGLSLATRFPGVGRRTPGRRARGPATTSHTPAEPCGPIVRALPSALSAVRRGPGRPRPHRVRPLVLLAVRKLAGLPVAELAAAPPAGLPGVRTATLLVAQPPVRPLSPVRGTRSGCPLRGRHNLTVLPALAVSSRCWIDHPPRQGRVALSQEYAKHFDGARRRLHRDDSDYAGPAEVIAADGRLAASKIPVPRSCRQPTHAFFWPPCLFPG